MLNYSHKTIITAIKAIILHTFGVQVSPKAPKPRSFGVAFPALPKTSFSMKAHSLGSRV